MSIKIFLFSVFFTMQSCQTAEPKQIVRPSIPYVVLKSTWKFCYELCGKKDQLAAVSTKGCICSNGGTIPFLMPSPGDVMESIEDEPQTKSLKDTISEYFKGNE